MEASLRLSAVEPRSRFRSPEPRPQKGVVPPVGETLNFSVDWAEFVYPLCGFVIVMVKLSVGVGALFPGKVQRIVSPAVDILTPEPLAPAPVRH